MADSDDRLAREREEIAARVARFRETQQRFERERHDYYSHTLSQVWRGRRPATSAR